ncbi:MAG: 16S rRNA (uracil(1498)-N(3))-methyltransferase [Clostridiales Family XIII bacterium]|jgi:16S rRNA (uracil1498-N3)-methyltransferase|nr:16S rRNA (uracil(1498)-N(3))-methyltransferase [Clostridiales Family XIII bacterium]
MRKFFVGLDQIDDRYIRITDLGDIKHIVQVLRMHVGDEIIVSDQHELEYVTRIESFGDELEEKPANAGMTNGAILLRIMDKQSIHTELHTDITVYQGIPKGSKMDEVIQKSVELGAVRIVPVFMKRSIPDKINSSKQRRFQAIAEESAKQSKRGVIPEVAEAMSMEAALADAFSCDYELNLLCYEDEHKTTLRSVLQEGKADSIAVWIGPEGGFSDAEVQQLESSGCRSVSLGRSILRTQTASTVALSMIAYEFEL